MIIIPTDIENNYFVIGEYLDKQISIKDEGKILKAKYNDIVFNFYVCDNGNYSVSAEDISLLYDEKTKEITGLDKELHENLEDSLKENKINQEYILCSAIWYKNDKKYRLQPSNVESGIVVCGWRHGNCITILHALFYPDFQNNEEQDKVRIHCLNNQVQGFLTNTNRFVDRKEAMLIAIEANQLNDRPKGESKILYSEDVW